jgi:glycosyltransferase involved in cell wall biosynthesis
MKVLLISGFFPPGPVAGSEKRTYGYATTLLKMGHEVQVLCAGTWDQGKQYSNGYVDDQHHGVPVRRLHLNWQLAPDPNRFLYQNPVIAGYLGDWLQGWRPDIVHVISCYTMSATVIEVAYTSGIPVVLTLVDFWFLCPKLSLLRANGALCDGRTTAWECLRCSMYRTKAFRWPKMLLPEPLVKLGLTWASHNPHLSQQRGLRGMALHMEHRKGYLAHVLRLVDRITAPSQVMHDVFVSASDRQDIEIIHSGHDLGWLREMPPRRPSDFVRFGYIGQISPAKGVHVLLEAFLAAGPPHNARLAIYGNEHQVPVYADQLRERAKKSEAIVAFPGAFASQQLGEVLSEIDVLIVPSLWPENNPRVIHEAFAAGVPVIGSDVGGISEFVRHGVNGLLFERGKVHDLVRLIRQISQERRLVDRLIADLPRVRTVEDEVEELVRLYCQLNGAGSGASGSCRQMQSEVELQTR